MKNVVFAAALPLALLASPALAQEETRDMGGIKAGALAGIDSVRLSDGTDGESESDIGFGAVLGYDVDLGQAVVGIEGEWSDSGVGVTYTDIDVAGDEARLSAGRDLYIGARVGFKAGASTLFYAKGGYTDAKIKLSYDDGTTVLADSDTVGGFRIGGGLEQAFGPNFAVRAEYRYSDYGEYSYAGFNTGLSVSRHQGMLGLIGKF